MFLLLGNTFFSLPAMRYRHTSWLVSGFRGQWLTVTCILSIKIESLLSKILTTQKLRKKRNYDMLIMTDNNFAFTFMFMCEVSGVIYE